MMQMIPPDKIVFMHKGVDFHYFFLNKDTAVGWIVDEDEVGKLEMRIAIRKGDTFMFKGQEKKRKKF